MNSREKNESQIAERRKARAAEIADSFEWVITALILAFVFRAFVMEAFRIPTGSMADTLRGAHFRMCCGQCGYRYNYGFDTRRYGLPEDTMPRGSVTPLLTRCPSCGYFQPCGGDMSVSYGDRILVLKCIYEYIEPKRWDVIVFHNPLEPNINYIKRLAALPGEMIEIIDGDVYIDGQISRKPEKVQEELWMPVYDNDYQPARPKEPLFNGHIWRQPFVNAAGSKWEVDKANPMKFVLQSGTEQINTMNYDTSIGNNFRATYAYDEVGSYSYLPYCSDLMVRYYAAFGEKSSAGVMLSKYQTFYKAWVGADGEMVIAKSSSDNVFSELVRRTTKPVATDKPIEIKFANVDHQLIFEVGEDKLTFDLGRRPNDAGQIMNIAPQVRIFGAGKLELSHVAVFRDIHYETLDVVTRASQGHPFKLGKDEFFALGDNSPYSADSRFWEKPGRGNDGIFYREGVVPRDYLVGKALFVYWPNGFKPYPGFPLSVIPDVGRMRFIHGGRN